MVKNTLTLALEGEIVLDDFANALINLSSLLTELTKEVAKDTDVSWVIDELYAGSAVATFKGVDGKMSSVEDIVNAYEIVGEHLQAGSEIPYSLPVQKYARCITNILNTRVTAIRFETSAKDIIVTNKPIGGEITQIKYTWSSIKGIVETISKRKKLSFTLWDSLFDKPVSCYFKEGQENIMRDVWGRTVIVSGRVGRRTDTGRPIVIRDVKNVRLIENIEPGSYRKAKGIFPWSPGDELPESIVGRLRSA